MMLVTACMVAAFWIYARQLDSIGFGGTKLDDEEKKVERRPRGEPHLIVALAADNSNQPERVSCHCLTPQAVVMLPFRIGRRHTVSGLHRRSSPSGQTDDDRHQTGD